MIEQLLKCNHAPVDTGVTFLGEVPVTELIDGVALAAEVGLTTGVAQYSDEPWLKFLLDEKTLLVSKKPYYTTMSWDELNAVNVVTGDRILEINGLQYRIRLLHGVNNDPYIKDTTTDAPGTWGSEWNRLFYPLFPNPLSKPASGVSGEGIVFGSQANYNEDDIMIYSGNGRSCWCQLPNSVDTSYAVLRGSSGALSVASMPRGSRGMVFGWRPVLELIE